MLIDRANSAVRAVAENWDRSADRLVWGADRKRLFGAIDDAGTFRAWEIPIDGIAAPDDQGAERRRARGVTRGGRR